VYLGENGFELLGNEITGNGAIPCYTTKCQATDVNLTAQNACFSKGITSATGYFDKDHEVRRGVTETMKRLVKSSIVQQFVSFAGVGVVATAIHYAILIALVHLGAINPALASAAGATVGAFVSYLLNYHYTFRSSNGHVASMAKFGAVAGIGIILNSLCMLLGTQVLGLYYILSQVIATGLVLIWTFLANRSWTFQRIAQ
jgi:putative flippase GtrA